MESTAIWVAKAIWDAIDEQWAARTGYPNTVRSLDCMPLWALNIANRFCLASRIWMTRKGMTILSLQNERPD